MNYLKKIVSGLIVISTISSSVYAEVNKYNEMDYVNNNNRTIADIAKEKEITLEEFLSLYNLPEDMPANTNEAAAFYSMTVENAAKMYGMELNEFISLLTTSTGEQDTFNKDMLWGEAQGKITLRNYIGDVSIDEFKKAYGLEESITGDTPFGEVRERIAKKQLEFNGLLSYFTVNDILVMADGKYLDFDVAPTIVNDRTMVPMRGIFEFFNAEIAWDGETKTIIAKSGDDIITMQIGQEFFFLNDSKIELDSPSVIINDRTLVPVRAISEALSREVAYNQKTKTVIIH